MRWDIIHKDHKLKRAARVEMQEREFRTEKHVRKEALEKFKEKPFQQRYAERLRGIANDDSK